MSKTKDWYMKEYWYEYMNTDKSTQQQKPSINGT